MKCLPNKTEDNEKRKKMFRDKPTPILKYCRKNYYINLLNKHKNDIKQAWQILDTISNGKKCENSNPSDFVVSNEYAINHQKVTSNKFYNFFVCIGPELDSEIQQINSNTANMYLENTANK